MEKLKLSWFNLLTQLNALDIPEVEVEEIQKGDTLLEALGKIKAQIAEAVDAQSTTEGDVSTLQSDVADLQSRVATLEMLVNIQTP